MFFSLFMNSPAALASDCAVLETPPDPVAPYPAAWTAWAGAAILALAQIVSTIDRSMLALVVDAVRGDLRISDVQIALLQGLAFAIFYVTVGLPLGAIADMVNRRRLLIAGVLTWSCATAACGLAQTFQQMFAARLLIGLGEAVLAPCAVTMIGDLFAPSRRGAPMGLYILGSMVAVGVGSLATGAVLDAAAKGAFDGVQILRGLAPWRIAFLLAGGFGVVIAALLLPLKEPGRIGAALAARRGLGLTQASVYLIRRWRIFLPFYGAVAAYGVGSSVAVSWGAALLTRTYGLSLGAVGKSLGAAQLAGALLGALMAALVVDRVVRRAGAGGKIMFAALIPVLAIPSTVAWLAPGAWLATAMLAEVMFVGALFGATMLSTTTELVPVGMKGLSVAIYAFVVTMIGSTLGPLAVAQITQTVFGDPHRVGQSMAIVGVAALTISSLLALMSRRQFGLALAEDELFARVVRDNAR